MKHVLLLIAALLITATASNLHAQESQRNQLAQYVRQPDPSFHWQILCASSYPGGNYAELLLSSQTWHGTTWRHQLYIIRSAGIPTPIRTAALFITGGHWGDQYRDSKAGCTDNPMADAYEALAAALRMPLAVLRQVPEEPLFDGQTEDGLIAYTFRRYLVTHDPTWPLLLPMVKSAVRAMDTVQSYASHNWQSDIQKFLVLGSSKRGWTTWLTAAVDPRVQTIAPMSFSMLDIPAQLRLQQTVWGKLSEEIADYSRSDLVQKVQSGQASGLMKLVDPWNYLADIKQPKLVIDGTNDPYWPVNSVNVYWPALMMDKYLLYLPNNGHSPTDYRRLFADLAALAAHMRTGMPLAKLEWHFQQDAHHVSLHLSSDQPLQKVRIWRAYSMTRDFRDSLWQKIPLFCRSDECDYTLAIPKHAEMALFGEAEYSRPDEPNYYLSTQVWVGGF